MEQQEESMPSDINHEIKLRQRVGTRNEDEELEAISKSFAADVQNPFKKLIMGGRSKSIVE
jgi:hypothetical protein